MHGILRVRCHKLEHSTDLHDFPTLGHFPVWNGSSLKIETPVVVLVVYFNHVEHQRVNSDVMFNSGKDFSEAFLTYALP